MEGEKDSQQREREAGLASTLKIISVFLVIAGFLCLVLGVALSRGQYGWDFSDGAPFLILGGASLLLAFKILEGIAQGHVPFWTKNDKNSTK